MKSFGTVIDESVQNNQALIQLQPRQPLKITFPERLIVPNTVQSYAKVLEQSIVTQDKPLLKDIITTSDDQMLFNTVDALNISKISPFLKLLEQLLLEDCQHTHIYANWIKVLVSRHLGVLLSNPENKQTILRLRKWIEKRVSNRTKLLQLRNSIPLGRQQEKRREFEPKFKYFEEEQRNSERGQVMIDQAALQDDDLYDDDLQA